MSLKNSCRFVGRVAKQPELQYLPSGTAMLRMGLPVNEPKKTDTGWEDSTTWVDITFWGKSAESAAERLGVGDMIAVDTRYTKERKEGTDKEERTYHNFTVLAWSRLSWARQENDAAQDEGEDEPF